MRINYMKRFREAYAKAFDEKNQLRTCPRQVYKKLIIACSRIDRSGTYYGNAVTGQMNVEAVQELKNNLQSTKLKVRQNRSERPVTHF